MKFEIFQDAANEFRWRLRARNGKIIADGEGYKSHSGCRKAVLKLVLGLKALTVIPVIDVKR